MKDYGKNGNKLVGHTPHPVACYLEDGSLVKEFKTLREAANWLVNEGKARTCNSAQVAITHSINKKQHYHGKDWSCKSAFGFIWKSNR